MHCDTDNCFELEVTGKVFKNQNETHQVPLLWYAQWLYFSQITFSNARNVRTMRQICTDWGIQCLKNNKTLPRGCKFPLHPDPLLPSTKAAPVFERSPWCLTLMLEPSTCYCFFLLRSVGSGSRDGGGGGGGMCACMYMCACVLVYMCAWGCGTWMWGCRRTFMGIHVEVRVDHWMSVDPHFIALRQVLSLLFYLDWLASKLSGFTCSYPVMLG